MKKPRRIQRRRTKGWRMPPNTVYVGRGSKWGNPYYTWKEDGVWWVGWNYRRRGALITKALAQAKVVRLYKRNILTRTLRSDARRELRGKNLACWCALDEPCHADVLLELANA